MQAKSTKKSAVKSAAKPSRKPAPKAVAQAQPAEAPKPVSAVQLHREAGLSTALFNKSRKCAIPVGVEKYNVPVSKLTARALALLSDLRGAYARKPFHARGLDNALLARLINSGLVEHVADSGHRYTDAKAAAQYLGDAADNPVRLAVSDAGAKFGKAQ